MTESYPAPPPKRDHPGYSDNKNCFLSSDVLVDIVKNCTFLKTHHDDVILRQGDRGDRYVQLTLVISTSVISNNCLSRRENLVLVLTQKSKIRLQNIVENRRNCSWGAISPLFHNIFNVYF